MEKEWNRSILVFSFKNDLEKRLLIESTQLSLWVIHHFKYELNETDRTNLYPNLERLFHELLGNAVEHSTVTERINYHIRVDGLEVTFTISNPTGKESVTKINKALDEYNSFTDPDDYFISKNDKNEIKGTGLNYALHRLRNNVIRINVDYVDSGTDGKGELKLCVKFKGKGNI